ncbi:hypothetical protein CsSME_00053168 [Camellia sinensis var. sinensis]
MAFGPSIHSFMLKWPLAHSFMSNWPLAHSFMSKWPLAHPFMSNWPLAHSFMSKWPLFALELALELAPIHSMNTKASRRSLTLLVTFLFGVTFPFACFISSCLGLCTRAFVLALVWPFSH